MAFAPSQTAAPNAEREQFTPGPWRVSQRDDVDDTQNRTVAACRASYRIPPAERAANAHLIATAPDFSAAARSTIERLADLPRYLRVNGERTLAAVVEEELAKHRNALAKARA